MKSLIIHPMKKLIVFDYSTGVIHVYANKRFGKTEHLDESEQVENFIRKKGHKLSECNWMVVKEVEIEYH